MDIKKFLEGKREKIDSAIEEVFPRKITQEWLEFSLGKPTYSYDAETISKSMAEPIWDFLDRGGKRWRPALAILCCEAVGGKEETALPFAPLVELVHNGTLCADDIEDGSKERRGKPCMHIQYGIDIACNNSSALYFLGLTTLYRNTQNISSELRTKLYDLYSEEMLRVSTGQAMDILWHKGKNANITEDQYLQMVVYKTGVLARFAAKMGAVLGRADETTIDALGKFAEALGIAFQIQDDILELTGTEFQKGKGTVGGDIHEGKRSLLVIRTLEKAPLKEKERLIEILDSHPTEEATILEAIDIIKKHCAIDYAKNKANEIVEKAWNEIDSVLKESEAKTTLKSFADYCVNRKM